MGYAINMIQNIVAVLGLIQSFTLGVEAFATNQYGTNLHFPFLTTRSDIQQNPRNIEKGAKSKTELHMMMESSSSLIDAMTSASTYIATIDADIANIADDDFALVFTGGIVVMFGGVFSALAVGAILNAGQSYGRVMADSYAGENNGDDPFEGLSDEERAKAEELLEKLRASKGGNKIPENLLKGKKSSETKESESIIEETSTEGKKEKISMFSDYDD